ncbi:hypothetical protein PPACK8108_LOCUS10755 [Phakopsora pachyrhizi]|uniref:Uncharacterized protein n=1 Tax=Phakopsora pachyrhizi TaxID=170000 RepID=A0AAV0B2I1_PHAPC|nr:hypothetical protein PPACK8108_LOCUS10755 [Phakopsora pachyrhizi]
MIAKNAAVLVDDDHHLRMRSNNSKKIMIMMTRTYSIDTMLLNSNSIRCSSTYRIICYPRQTGRWEGLKLVIKTLESFELLPLVIIWGQNTEALPGGELQQHVQLKLSRRRTSAKLLKYYPLDQGWGIGLWS